MSAYIKKLMQHTMQGFGFWVTVFGTISLLSGIVLFFIFAMFPKTSWKIILFLPFTYFEIKLWKKYLTQLRNKKKLFPHLPALTSLAHANTFLIQNLYPKITKHIVSLFIIGLFPGIFSIALDIFTMGEQCKFHNISNALVLFGIQGIIAYPCFRQKQKNIHIRPSTYMIFASIELLFLRWTINVFLIASLFSFLHFT